MQFNRRHAERVFTILRVRHKTSTHHVAGYIEIDGIRALPVHYSHSSYDYTSGFVNRFRKSLHLTPEEFARLVSGDMTRDEYIEIVRPRLRLVQDY